MRLRTAVIVTPWISAIRRASKPPLDDHECTIRFLQEAAGIYAPFTTTVSDLVSKPLRMKASSAPHGSLARPCRGRPVRYARFDVAPLLG